MAKRNKSAKGAGPAPAPKEETAEQRLSRLERENERLRRENELLRMDREILKKAAAFFAKESE
jgi:transposase